MKQEREREITAERERELKEGRAAKKMMTQILKVLNRDKVLLPGVLESKQPSALVQSNTRGRWRSATKRVQESQRMQAHSRMVVSRSVLPPNRVGMRSFLLLCLYPLTPSCATAVKS